MKKILHFIIIFLLAVVCLSLFNVLEVYAYSTDSFAEISPVAWANYPTSIDDVMQFLEDNESLYSSYISFQEISSSNILISKDNNNYEIFLNYGNDYEFLSEWNGENWYALDSDSNSIYLWISDNYNGIFRYYYNNWVGDKSSSMLSDTSNFISNYDIYIAGNSFITASFSSGGSGDTPGGDTPGGDIPEEEDNIILQILKTLFIPTEEDLEEIKDLYEEEIMSHFGLADLSFDNDLDNSSVFLEDYPHFLFNFMGADIDIDLGMLADMLNTPISFGYRKDTLISDNTTSFYEGVATGGLTPKKIISLLIAIGIFRFNLAMYNRFLGSGGESV